MRVFSLMREKEACIHSGKRRLPRLRWGVKFTRYVKLSDVIFVMRARLPLQPVANVNAYVLTLNKVCDSKSLKRCKGDVNLRSKISQISPSKPWRSYYFFFACILTSLIC